LEIRAAESSLKSTKPTITHRKKKMARLLDGATSSEMKRGKNLTYALIETTVFDVWRDLKEYEEGGLKRPAKDQDG
jgi:hypothetical protein